MLTVVFSLTRNRHDGTPSLRILRPRVENRTISGGRLRLLADIHGFLDNLKALELLKSDEISRYILHCNSGLPVVTKNFEMLIKIENSNSLVASMTAFELTSAEMRFC